MRSSCQMSIVRARALDIYSINCHQLGKHATAFEHDLDTKPKDPQLLSLSRSSQVVCSKSRPFN